MNFDNIPWQRMNPSEHLKIQYNLTKKIFDGDHAITNEFSQRRHWKIDEVIKLSEQMEKLIDKEKEDRQNLDRFKVEALSGNISINLKDVNRELFYDSKHLNEFWRVSYELFLKQNQKGLIK